MLRKLLFYVFIFSVVLYANEKVLHFAPLPTKKIEQNIKEFIPLDDYVGPRLGYKIEYVHLKNYRDILDGFKNGTIDVAYLGPLPFVELYKEYPYAKPIVVFKQKNGLAKYRCVLSKFTEDKLDFSKKIKVALTQPLSTCGYLMSSKLLREKFGVDIAKNYYQYTMSHTNALTQTLQGKFDIAGAKESIAKKFESLGMQIVAKSELLPGFALVVNQKTLSQSEIKKIQDFLLSLSQEEVKKIGGIIKKGIVKATLKDYEVLKTNCKIPQIGNMQ